MKYGVLLLIGTVSSCIATTPPPCYIECGLLDRVADAAKPGLITRSGALEILERVAEGRMDDAGAGLEEQVGLKPRQLRGAEFKLIFYTMNAEDVRFQEVAILKDA